MGTWNWTKHNDRVAGGFFWTLEARECTVELYARPHHCDRGRWQAYVIDPGFPTNPNPFDGHDGFPRYYFDLERGMREIEALFDVREYKQVTSREALTHEP